ncbi:MAG: protein translocase subunit SecF [Deltaproteobacteria bacterium]|nr:protein translocase subunit SecF [Deltaproteobacteria bacterium]
MELIKPNTNIDFLGNRHYAYIFTTVMILLALASIPIKGHIRLGVDFTGGAMVQVKFNKSVHTDEIRDAFKSMGEGSVIQKLVGVEEFVIRLETHDEGSEQLNKQVNELLTNKFGKDSFEVRSLEMVGPKVGKDLQQSAIWATVIALSLLLIYMAFRFTFTMGLGAIVCLIHDLCILYGFFAWTGLEFNLTILAAFLTVIGYDINDTIVVCDRVRDNLKLMKKQPLIDIFNVSINQTLSRTVLTSCFTLLSVVALLFFGTPVLQDFAWALVVGIVFGTYSSIFVASPLVLELDRVLPVKRG